MRANPALDALKTWLFRRAHPHWPCPYRSLAEFPVTHARIWEYLDESMPP